MFKIALARLQQKHRTIAFPDGPAPELGDRFRGRPVIDSSRCRDGCGECAKACPTGAIAMTDVLRVDLGKCLFCADCQRACDQGGISYSRDYRLATVRRADLITDEKSELKLAQSLQGEMKKLFGRSLKLRQVSAGGCNGCEADLNVLGTVGWDLGRFGVQFVASPRHADGLLITGPITENMRLAVQKTYDAVPDPKIVIAVGACAIAGGPYIDHKQVNNGADSMLPVDLYIPGCPPHPLTTLDGILRLLGRIESGIAECPTVMPAAVHLQPVPRRRPERAA
jgi:Ni,Fe-hydrogenase III small subunit/NAD-dependent dihydropyrimidine dehydrogenase PreA subunit